MELKWANNWETQHASRCMLCCAGVQKHLLSAICIHLAGRAASAGAFRSRRAPLAISQSQYSFLGKHNFWIRVEPGESNRRKREWGDEQERCHKRPWLCQFWRYFRVENLNRDELAPSDFLKKIGLSLLNPIFPRNSGWAGSTQILKKQAGWAGSTCIFDVETRRRISIIRCVFFNSIPIHIGMVGHKTQF